MAKPSRIAEARQAAGFTQQEAADALEITLQGYQYYEYGKRDIKASTIIKMCKLFNVSAAYLLGVTDEIDVPVENYVNVPLYGSIAAGTPIEMIASNDTYPIPERMQDAYPECFLLRVCGESMNRVLPNGSYALIVPCDDIDYDGKPYAICVNGYDATIKRVHKLANGFELVPDSNDPTYRPKVYDYGVEGTGTITVIGRVVWYCVPWDWEF